VRKPLFTELYYSLLGRTYL